MDARVLMVVLSSVSFQALNCVGRTLENRWKPAPRGNDTKASKSVHAD